MSAKRLITNIAGALCINFIAAALIVCTAHAGPPHSALNITNFHQFDFGPSKSKPWAGYTRVSIDTTYSDKTGVGWVSHVGTFSDVDRSYPEPLSRTMVLANKAEFRLDLPNGDYRVWIRKGDAQLNAPMYWIYRSQKLSLNGMSIINENPSAHDIFEVELIKHYYTRWTPDMDVYGIYVESCYTEKIVDVSVTDGSLTMRVENVPLTAMIVYPANAAKEIEVAYLPELRRQLRLAANFRQKPLPVETGMASDLEKSRGFSLFSRDPEEPVYPTSRPRDGERVNDFNIFAARAQREPIQFALWPLRDLKQVSVSIDPLSSEDGATIPSSAVDIRFVRYTPFAELKNAKPNELMYSIEPHILDHLKPFDIPANTTYRYWLRVTIPNNQAAGVYSGNIHIKIAGKTQMKLPLRLQVIPFTLSDSDISFGGYYGPNIPWYSYYWKANITGPNFDNDSEMDRITFATERAYFKFMKEIGHNGAAFADDLRGQLRFQGIRPVINDKVSFVRWMDEYAKAGLGTMPFYGFKVIGGEKYLDKMAKTGFKQFSPEWTAAYRNIITDFAQEGKKRGWPEILWYVSDELSNERDKGTELGLKLTQTAKGIAGIRTIASMNGSYEYPLVPNVTITMPNFAFPITNETIDMIRKTGSEFWIYNCTDSRFSFGLYPWALKAGGRYQWHYGYPNASGRWGLTMNTPYFLQHIGPNYEVFPVARADAHEQGINDYRYLKALEDAIQKHPANNDDVRKARIFLEDLRSRVPVDMQNIIKASLNPKLTGAEDLVEGKWTSHKYLNNNRWAIALHIVDLAK